MGEMHLLLAEVPASVARKWIINVFYHGLTELAHSTYLVLARTLLLI